MGTLETQTQSSPGRILALDLGERRIGLAVSDELGLTAQGLETLLRVSLREDLRRLEEMARRYGATLVLIGNPVNMNGTEGKRSGWAREFAEKLQSRSGLQVRLWDERLTTRAADRVLRESGISRGKRGKAVDRLSAVLLLQSYLETVSPGPAAGGAETA